MQSPVLLAFRKRLKNRGYTQISIKRCNKPDDVIDNDDYYCVTAVEPLAGAEVSLISALTSFHSMMR